MVVKIAAKPQFPYVQCQDNKPAGSLLGERALFGASQLHTDFPTKSHDLDVDVTENCYLPAPLGTLLTPMPRVDSQAVGVILSDQERHRYTSSPSQTDPPIRTDF